jgi:hypothetical protein
LAWIAAEFAQYQRGRDCTLFDRGGQPQNLISVAAHVFDVERAVVGATFRAVQFGVSQITDTARKIKKLPFSPIVIDMLFSIDYHYNEF